MSDWGGMRGAGKLCVSEELSFGALKDSASPEATGIGHRSGFRWQNII